MTGVAVFDGISIGKTWLVEEKEISIPEFSLTDGDIDDELSRLEEWKNKHGENLKHKKDMILETVGEEESKIFDAHLEILNDPELEATIIGHIKNDHMNGVKSIYETMQQFLQLFKGIDDPYIRERAVDIEDVLTGWIKVGLGIEESGLASISEDVVLFANDLTPSDTVHFTSFVKGVVLQEGSVTSHTAIVAKAKGIPTIVGFKDLMPKQGQVVVLDTKAMDMIVEPDQETYDTYMEKVKEIEIYKASLAKLKDLPALTVDGREIEIFGNVGALEDAHATLDNGGFGVGLLRTELIYMESKDWPTEEEQYKIYYDIASTVNEEVIIRTLDIGGDKVLPYYKFDHEENPFLGLRALRFCLKNQDIFLTQLKAILRVSAEFPVKVMFPMVGAVSELIEARKVLDLAKAELKEEGKAFNDHIAVGIMVEIPSVVFALDMFEGLIDFVSIGTNDLCQYTLAVDRMNPEVAYLYDSENISILRMIKHVVKSCHAMNVKVGVCGEMAGSVKTGLILLGLGVDELSMSPAMIPYVKDAVRKASYKELEEKYASI